MATTSNPAAEEDDPRLIRVSEHSGEVRLLAVRYDGTCFANDPIDVDEVKYKSLYVVEENDLVLSNINAVNGAIGVVPAGLAGCVVSHEYTVLRAKNGIDPRVLQLTLRAPECRADLLLLASGIGRHRVTYAGAAKTRVPLGSKQTTRDVVRDLDEAERLRRKAAELQERARRRLEDDLEIDTPRAKEILQAFKPPK